MKYDGKVLRISLLLTRDIEVIRPQRRPWDSYSWDSRFLSWVNTDVLFQGREYRRNILFTASFETSADSTGGCDWDPSESVYVSAMLLWYGFYYRQKEVIKLTEIFMQPALWTRSICIELQDARYKNFPQWILICADALVFYIIWHSIYTGPTHHFSIL